LKLCHDALFVIERKTARPAHFADPCSSSASLVQSAKTSDVVAELPQTAARLV
jgi:hypothetical protein